MVARKSVCLRQLAGGRRAEIVRFGRFLDNERVTPERVIAGWGEGTSSAVAGRHVLAIQDSSDLNFRTSEGRRRGLGKIGKGVGHGLVLHAMLAVDAATGGCLGLVAGRVWTRSGEVERSRKERVLADKESSRWLETGEAAKHVLAGAACVTAVSDRESDIYALWARLPEANFHVLARAMHDRALADGGTLSTAPGLHTGDDRVVTLRARVDRQKRDAKLRIRFGRVALARPKQTPEPDLPECITLTLVEVTERNPPAGAEPIEWRLLTTHEVSDQIAAWRIVDWYRRRWTIEQLFRTLKQQGLQLEDSQIETADRLMKLTAIAAQAACLTMQLVHARDGTSDEPASLAFTPTEIAALETLIPRLEGKTALQKNPHRPRSLAWAAWAIAKLGGWDGYPKSTPPGPITFRNGLEYFQAIAAGWALRDV
jgi:Transposase DDE domain